MAKTNLTTATVLAFERKLSPSDALLHAGIWDDRAKTEAWYPVTVQEKAVLGTISNYLKNAVDSDPAKLDAKIQNPNPQRVDTATLPFNTDTLKISFTLRVLGNLATPSACNNADYQAALATIIADYQEEHQFTELARRYAANLANGRFLWRNRVGAEAVEVRIHQRQNQAIVASWTFDSFAVGTRDFDYRSADLDALTEVIRQGLLGSGFVLLEVEAYARLGKGQEVFPSQELVLDNESSSQNQKNKKSKFLYHVNGIAALHSQKIGNALRTIDTWYPGADELGPIAVEPYGAVTNRGIAYRQPKEKLDFYSLRNDWVLKNKAPDTEQQHYVIATLIRGGVFGEKSE